MKLHRVSLLLIASCVFLAPLHAGSDKRLRSQTVKDNGSVRVKMMGRTPLAKAPVEAPTRGGNLTLWVAPSPLGNNATGDGSQAPPAQPKLQSTHSDVVALDSQSWSALQASRVVHSPSTVTPSHSALRPLHCCVTSRCCASAPQAVPSHRYSVVVEQV